MPLLQIPLVKASLQWASLLPIRLRPDTNAFIWKPDLSPSNPCLLTTTFKILQLSSFWQSKTCMVFTQGCSLIRQSGRFHWSLWQVLFSVNPKISHNERDVKGWEVHQASTPQLNDKQESFHHLMTAFKQPFIMLVILKKIKRFVALWKSVFALNNKGVTAPGKLSPVIRTISVVIQEHYIKCLHLKWAS